MGLNAVVDKRYPYFGARSINYLGIWLTFPFRQLKVRVAFFNGVG